MSMEKKTTGRVLMHRYEVGRLLGKGAFAKVYYARSIAAGHSVAIKVIDKEKIMKAELIEQIKREISGMRLVRHPNVVQLYEVMASKSKIYFVLEYVKGGELFGKVARGRLREDVAHKYFQQLISAVDFCHSRGVYHRDLKPENLLLDERGNLKVSDFGLSALAVSARQDGLLHTTCGTPAYVAPEVIARKGYDGAKADIWSCGVILFVLLAGYLPFQSPNLMDMYRKIARGDFRCPHWFSSNSRRLLSRILDPNPSSRIPIANILDSPWLHNAKAKQQEGVNDNEEEHAGDGGDGETSGRREERCEKPTMLNAFDIISLSSGFHLSSLFEEGGRKDEAIFTSNQPPEAIMAKLEETARGLKLKVKTKERGSLKLEGSDARRKVALAIDADIFEVTPMFHVVEVKKRDGDTCEYERLWQLGIRPALEEIGRAWDSD